jgi:hypothetical protein
MAILLAEVQPEDVIGAFKHGIPYFVCRRGLHYLASSPWFPAFCNKYDLVVELFHRLSPCSMESATVNNHQTVNPQLLKVLAAQYSLNHRGNPDAKRMERQVGADYRS